MNKTFKEYFYEVQIEENWKTALTTGALLGATTLGGIADIAKPSRIETNKPPIEQTIYKMSNKNNPGNIKYSMNNNWLGQIEPRITKDGRKFCQFDTIEHGIRALIKIFKTYSKRNINTIQDIIKTFAPQTDNNETEKYIQDVSNWMNFSTNQPLNIYNNLTTKEEKREILFKLLNAIIKKEVGRVISTNVIYNVIDQNI